MFFVNKGKWLEERFYTILSEMEKRGLNAKRFVGIWDFKKENIEKGFYNNWSPKEVDL